MSSNQKTTSSASMKLLQDHLASKRRSQAQQQGKLSAQKAQKNKTDSQVVIEADLHKQENEWSVEEEYDPMVPNSYELLLTEYMKVSEKQRLMSLMGVKPATGQNIPNMLEFLDKLEDDQYLSTDSKKNRGTSIAPPPSLTTNSSSFSETNTDLPTVNLAAKLSSHNQQSEKSETQQHGSSVAAKIMSKMGYKAGQGLGKDEQGMSMPLAVEKSGLNAGRIIEPTKAEFSSTGQKKTEPEKVLEEKNSKMASLLRDSTRILLLQNMVGPGEVDDDLEAETKEECKKYGDIVKCLIFEIPNKRVPDSEAVRIFVEFRQVESAIKAVSDLDGRYFGGRIVRASFYSLERFNKYDLGPAQGK